MKNGDKRRIGFLEKGSALLNLGRQLIMNTKGRYPGSFNLLIIIAALIFLVEVSVMLIFHPFDFKEAMINASLLTLLVFPLLYVFSSRPLILEIKGHKQAQEKNKELIEKLKKEIAKVKLLSGLIPICASCKKIRDDKGYWNQIETYIRDHSEATFTHGLCPDCAKKLRREFEEK